MYYLINKDREVLGKCKEKKKIYSTILACFNEIAEDKIRQCVDWSVVDESGYWYIKKDKNYILRKYTKYAGYVYNSFHYEELTDVVVSFYEDESNSKKKSYLDVVKDRSVYANIKDIQKEGVQV